MHTLGLVESHRAQAEEAVHETHVWTLLTTLRLDPNGQMLQVVELLVQVGVQVLLFVFKVNPAWHELHDAWLVDEHVVQG